MTICNTRPSPPALYKLLLQIIGDNCFPFPFVCICQHLWHSMSTNLEKSQLQKQPLHCRY
jgi:hypothetical protein